MTKIEYDLEKYPFPNIVEKILHIEPGRMNLISGNGIELATKGHDQHTIYHQRFYSTFRESNWISTYLTFLHDIILPFFGEAICFQAIPTFRIHLPNNLAVAEYHKDKQYNHSENEISFYLPLTKAFGNNTIWAESVEDKGDFTPMLAKAGDLIKWDSSNLEHGNHLNDTGFTRVSVDFRVIPYSLYTENDKETVSAKVPLKIGHYFGVMCK